jgi:hypothetical protein
MEEVKGIKVNIESGAGILEDVKIGVAAGIEGDNLAIKDK